MGTNSTHSGSKFKGVAEQLDSSVQSQAIRKFAKRRTNKALRRAAKQNPEDAPTKARYRGYVS